MKDLEEAKARADWYDNYLGEIQHTMAECPEHGGGFDCTPFCRVCEGEQGYCTACEEIL